MYCTISLSDDGNYICVKCKGEINRRIAMSQVLESHSLGNELNIRHYLVDLTEARYIDSSFEDYRFICKNMHSTEGSDRGTVVAVVADPEDHSHDFIETVSRNAGVNIRLFRDINCAKRHLSGK